MSSEGSPILLCHKKTEMISNRKPQGESQTWGNAVRISNHIYGGRVATLQEWSDSWTDMVLAFSAAGLFKWRQFEPVVILLAVGWYLRFSLSYHDVEELLAERDLHADHVTIWRWVQRYAP
jgi:hypothetical protein